MIQQPGQSAHHSGGQPYLVGQPIVMDPQNQGLQQQGVVVIQAQQKFNNGYSNYKKKASIALGALQIIMALLLLGLNTESAILGLNGGFLATGWWAAPIYIIAGSCGIAAGCRPTGCTVIPTMVMSIISCVTMIFIAVQSGFNLTGYCYSGNQYRSGSSSSSSSSSSTSSCPPTQHLLVGCFFLVFGFCEFLFAVAQSALCCESCCCCRTPMQPSQVMVYGNGGFNTFMLASTQTSQNGVSRPFGTYLTPSGGATRPIPIATAGAPSGKAKPSHATGETCDNMNDRSYTHLTEDHHGYTHLTESHATDETRDNVNDGEGNRSYTHLTKDHHGYTHLTKLKKEKVNKKKKPKK